MDKFVVDLDKVLDDLELNEDEQNVPGAGKSQLLQGTMDNPYSALNEPVIASSTMPSHIIKTDSVDSTLSYDAPYSPSQPLDLSEADFGPSPPKPSLLDSDVFSPVPTLLPSLLPLTPSVVGSQPNASLSSQKESSPTVSTNTVVSKADQTAQSCLLTSAQDLNNMNCAVDRGSEEKYYTHAGIVTIDSQSSTMQHNWADLDLGMKDTENVESERQEPIGQDNSPRGGSSPTSLTDFQSSSAQQHIDINTLTGIDTQAVLQKTSSGWSESTTAALASLSAGTPLASDTTSPSDQPTDGIVHDNVIECLMQSNVSPSDRHSSEGINDIACADMNESNVGSETSERRPIDTLGFGAIAGFGNAVGFGDTLDVEVDDGIVDDYLGDGTVSGLDVSHVESQGSVGVVGSVQDTLSLLDPYLSKPSPTESGGVSPVVENGNMEVVHVKGVWNSDQTRSVGDMVSVAGGEEGASSLMLHPSVPKESQLNGDGEGNVVESSSPGSLGIGARPKEPTQTKRPSSLLGLSTVMLDPANRRPTPPLQLSNDHQVAATETSNDVINRQLAEANKNTLLKKQMNVEIKNQIQQEMLAEDPTDNRYVEECQSNTWLAASPTEETPGGKQRRPNSLNIPRRPEISSASTEGEECTESSELNVDMTDSPSQDDAPESSEDSVQRAIIQQQYQQQIAPQAAPSSQTQAEVVAGLDRNLGVVPPVWIPDSDAPACMACHSKFTFTKRRHHCRSCGKVFCNTCCKMKRKLQYLESKEGRVCSTCYQTLSTIEALDKLNTPGFSPNPNNPAEYCSTISPYQQAQANVPPPSVIIPAGVLKREGSQKRGEGKSVIFSDGIRPGGDLTELDSTSDVPYRKSSGRPHKKVERLPPDGAAPENGDEGLSAVKTRMVKMNDKNQCLIPVGGLPPVVSAESDGQAKEDLMEQIKMEDAPPVVFAINKNLFVLVKILNLDCCVNRTCWCFTTRGLCTVGQEEVVIVLECLPDESQVPRDIFVHVNKLYQDASKGVKVSHMGHSIVTQPFLDSRDHCGFLYLHTTFQCLQKLMLPEPPYLFAVLLQKWETPWAKVFPLRLMLRLGAEYRYYPCPVISVRHRRPVYCEVGHTIMNLLADFRNFQYMLPHIPGVTVHMQDKKTYINFPRNRYDQICKVVSNCNDHVMALAATFSMEADSHLVCIQNDEGTYQTQAINIQNKPRKVTGASFVVFNGALKASTGLSAKSSIVEDGLMVQITPETMTALKQAIHEMKDMTINCGAIDAVQHDEAVQVTWTEDDKNVNIGVHSPIDNKLMDGIPSLNIHNATDFIGENHTIRWTEVFFIRNQDDGHHDPIDLSRLAEMLASACCIALTPHLDKMKEAGLTKIGLRCNIDSDCVGYEVGSCGATLPPYYMTDLDNEMIPVIHNAASQSHTGPVVLELIFYVIA